METQESRGIANVEYGRRSLLKGIGGVGAALATGGGLSALLAACGSPTTGSASGGAAGTLTFTSWGGTTQEAQQTAWTDPFSSKSGIKVVQAGPTDYGKLQTMVQNKAVSWNVVDVEGYFVRKAAKLGLLSKLDMSVIPQADLFPEWVTPNGVGDFAYSFVISYRTDVDGGKHPGDWAEFFDTRKFPGKRSFYKYAYSGVFEAALLADGVSGDALYPIDFDRAFAKLDTIKKDIVWWGTGAESQLQLQNGTVAYSSMWNGRVYNLLTEGVPVAIEWNQNLQAAAYLVIPKGAPAEGNKLIATALSPQPQADFAAKTSYAPVNKKALPLIDPKLTPYLSTTDVNRAKGVLIDDDFWATGLDDVQKRWQSWLVS